MDKSKPNLYKMPQGTEGLFLEDAYRRQRLVAGLQEVFTAWGYLPVQTPAFDYYDIFSPHLDAAAKEKIYRLVDREGDLLMLRSDITLFLARTLGVTLREGHAPLRVSYADTILRHQNVEDISANEFFQIGAEFVGSVGPDGDCEILLLLDEVLNFLDMPGARIHLGTRGLLKALFPDLEGATEAAILTALTTRRFDRLAAYLAGLGVAPDLSALLQDIFAYIGSTEGFGPLLQRAQKALPAPALTALQAVLTIARTLEGLDRHQRFRLDFSEVGRQPYYTGIVFSAYAPGVGDAVASGGRYDDLLENFGLKTPSVGFAFHLKKVEHLTGTPDRFHPAPALTAQGADFAARFAEARRLRNSGATVKLS